MVNDTDELPLPLRNYTKSFTDYVLAQAYLKDKDGANYDRMFAAALTSKSNFVSQLAPRDKSGPTMIDLVDTMGEADDFWP